MIASACLPFKPCTSPSPVTPVSSSGGKKRRVTPSNFGARCAAKNMKVEVKKAPEKSPPQNPSDDKVVSSSCEVECSNAVSCSSAAAKSLPSRSSLDYFVRTTQRLEVTTSSTDGDLVDLTMEDDAEAEALALSGTSLADEADITDVTPGSVSGDCTKKVPVSVAAKPAINTIAPLSCVVAEEVAEMVEANDELEKDCYVISTESKVQCENEAKPSCSTTASSHHRENRQEVVGSVDTPVDLDIQNASSDDRPARNTEDDCVRESVSYKSSSDANDDGDMDVIESPTCDSADDTDQHSQARDVLVKLNEENITAANNDDKPRASTTTTSANMTGHINHKPKVSFVNLYIHVCRTFVSLKSFKFIS